MDERSFKTLEFDKLLLLLQEHAASEPGRKLCLKLRPSANRRRVISWQQNTADAKKRLETAGHAPVFSGFSDISDILKRLRKEGSLTAGELLSAAGLLAAADSVRRYGLGQESEDSLSEFFGMLEPLHREQKAILEAIVDENTIADSASRELSDCRRRIMRTEDGIHAVMNARLNALRDMLSDPVITQRDGRYCLPIKAENRSHVPGIVHDVSKTGLTLFIEPMAAVDLHNSLIDLRAEEKREIEKILSDLSLMLRPHIDAMLDDIKLLQRLDMIFAKASFAEELSAESPVFSEDRSIDIRGARHPLLSREHVVPIDLRLGKNFTTLVVTGPNTGGKTVSLKTLGLLSLMAQAGLMIPAMPGSAVGIFDDIYADIGDEQSIEQSLSTFSAHMSSIVYILKAADRKSLCLFDELMSGTDPTEGAALGIAVLQFLTKKKIRTMATTHYAELKAYAFQTEGVENASCEFDVETLSPTYRLSIGLPGSSNAFAISRRLGLGEDIIEDAKTRIERESGDFEELVRKLNFEKSSLERMNREAAHDRGEASKLMERVRMKEEKLTKRREKIIDEAEKKAQKILLDARKTADLAIANIRKAESTGSAREAEAERKKLRDALSNSDTHAALSVKGPSKPVSQRDIHIGDSLRIMPLGGAVGIVTSLPDKDRNVSLRIGSMQTRQKVSDLERAAADEDESDAKKYAPEREPWGSFAPKSLTISPELNLIGKTTDEAVFELEKYLDDAYMSGIGVVRIIHGRGTGALRDMVHRKLKNTAYVSSYRLGEHGEGDTGVTVVTFETG